MLRRQLRKVFRCNRNLQFITFKLVLHLYIGAQQRNLADLLYTLYLKTLCQPLLQQGSSTSCCGLSASKV